MIVSWVSRFEDGLDIKYDESLLKSAVDGRDSVWQYIMMNRGRTEEVYEHGTSVLICAYYQPIKREGTATSSQIKACIRLCCSGKLFESKKASSPWTPRRMSKKDIEKGKSVYSMLVESTEGVMRATTQVKPTTAKNTSVKPKAGSPVKPKVSAARVKSVSSVNKKTSSMLKKKPVRGIKRSTVSVYKSSASEESVSSAALQLNKTKTLLMTVSIIIVSQHLCYCLLSIYCKGNCATVICFRLLQNSFRAIKLLLPIN